MKRWSDPPSGKWDFDRRRGADRRRPGRPRLLTDARLDWAIKTLKDGWPQDQVLQALCINERTLERRLQVRRDEDRRRSTKYLGLKFRCPSCAGSTSEPTCPYCRTMINPIVADYRYKDPLEGLDGGEQL